MKTVLITGANGFVGSYLVRDLLAGDYKIIATGKGPSRLPFENENLIYEPLDFTKREDVDQLFQRYRPQVVVHSGALSKPDECELEPDRARLVNVTGTENILAAAAQYKAYVLFMSTDFVFAGTSLQYKEEDEPAPVNRYGEMKKLAEEAVQSYNGNWAIVRTILVYGHPRSGRQNILTIVANALHNHQPLKIFSDQLRTPTYVEDLSGALATMVAQEQTGIYHISGADAVTPYQMACAVATHFQFPMDSIQNVTAETFAQPAARPPITGFDLTKARNDLNYQPTSFTDGLQKTFDGWQPGS